MSMKFNYAGARLAISTRTVSLIFYLEDKVKNLTLLSLGWHFLPFVPRPREFPSTYGSRLQSRCPSPAGLRLSLRPGLCVPRGGGPSGLSPRGQELLPRAGTCRLGLGEGTGPRALRAQLPRWDRAGQALPLQALEGTGPAMTRPG